jgi:hypothetical protein
MQNGKGDSPRPMKIGRSEFNRRYEKIFRKRNGRIQAAVPEREVELGTKTVSGTGVIEGDGK